MDIFCTILHTNHTKNPLWTVHYIPYQQPDAQLIHEVSDYTKMIHKYSAPKAYTKYFFTIYFSLSLLTCTFPTDTTEISQFYKTEVHFHLFSITRWLNTFYHRNPITVVYSPWRIWLSHVIHCSFTMVIGGGCLKLANLMHKLNKTSNSAIHVLPCNFSECVISSVIYLNISVSFL